MSDFCIYRLSDGEICISGDTPDPDTVRVPDGCALLHGPGENATHYVANGVVTPYTPEQAAAKAVRPDYLAAWSNTAFAWSDIRTLDEAKAEQWALVAAGRDAMIYGTITWDGSVFQIDAESRNRIGDAVVLARCARDLGQNDFSITWTLADNTTRVLSTDQLTALGMAVGAYFQAGWNQGTALRSQINAATTVEAVKTIVWTPPAG